MRSALRTWYLSLAGVLLVACGGDNPAAESSAVATLTLSSATLVLDKGTRTLVTADIRDAAGASLSGEVTIEWSSSQPSTASVDEDGYVTGVSLGGPVSITAEAGGKSATTSVMVVPPVALVQPAITVVGVNSTRQLTPRAREQSGAELPTGTVTWLSTSPSVATVDQLGAVTGVSSGTAVLEANIAGKTAFATVHVGTPSPNDGSWLSTATGVSFDVDLGIVTAFRLNGLTLAAQGNAAGGVCLAEFASQPYSRVSSGTFSFTFEALLGLEPITPGFPTPHVNGEFSGSSDVSGSVSASFLAITLYCPLSGANIRGLFQALPFSAQRTN